MPAQQNGKELSPKGNPSNPTDLSEGPTSGRHSFNLLAMASKRERESDLESASTQSPEKQNKKLAHRHQCHVPKEASRQSLPPIEPHQWNPL